MADRFNPVGLWCRGPTPPVDNAGKRLVADRAKLAVSVLAKLLHFNVPEQSTVSVSNRVTSDSAPRFFSKPENGITSDVSSILQPKSTETSLFSPFFDHFLSLGLKNSTIAMFLRFLLNDKPRFQTNPHTIDNSTKAYFGP